ncbi:uncharacterized protein LOC129579580 isoform X2 [Sitodiplosis mosellana]|uniref:uncharacterized protein LOC129579580 isoform X2 n=1 Tax=Sitodiplosis mosellana TaxID=263140 RepID=UPI00244508DA|nr:uncharacterized protein LOC129579580 isoform X2 [Sitodiplosis mosellana]
MYRVILSVLIIVTYQVGGNVSEFVENEILHRFEKSLSKGYDLDVWNALNALNVTMQKFNEFQSGNGLIESRDAMINSRIGVFLFTRYCGPGARLLNKIFKTDERTYSNIDTCCRLHDECPDYVLQPHDYERYPELDVRPQFFSRGFGLNRCMAYEVDYNLPKKWQWFDVLPPYLEIYNFPQFIQSALSFS